MRTGLLDDLLNVVLILVSKYLTMALISWLSPYAVHLKRSNLNSQ